MTYKLTDLAAGITGSISEIGEIGLLREDLRNLMFKSGKRITIHQLDPPGGNVVISFRYLKLCLLWEQAAAIQVRIPPLKRKDV